MVPSSVNPVFGKPSQRRSGFCTSSMADLPRQTMYQELVLVMVMPFRTSTWNLAPKREGREVE